MPRKVVSSVVGIGGMAGAVGGMFMAEFTGWILYWTNNNNHIPFYVAATAYPLALSIIHLLSAWVLIALSAAIWHIRRGNVRASTWGLAARYSTIASRISLAV